MSNFTIKRAGLFALGFILASSAVPAQAQLFGRSKPTNEKGMGEVRAPKLTFEEPSYDFGVIPDTDIVETVVRFTNTGDDMLIIEKVDSECGCTVPELEVYDYLPGESGTMAIQFHPKDRPGKHQKNVTIRSNDIENSTMQFRVNVEVYEAVKPSRPTLPLGRLIKGEGGSGSVTLTTKRDHFEINKVAIAGENLSCEFSPAQEVTLDDGSTAKEITATFTIDKDTPMGWLDRNIVFNTVISSEDGSRLIEHPVRFHVSGQVAGRVQASPERLSFGTPSPGSTMQREVRFYGLTEDTFNIKNVRIETESDVELSVEQSTIDVNRKEVPRIIVSGTAPDTRGSFTGKIYVTTDLPDEPEITINFFGSVRAPLSRPIFEQPASEKKSAPADGSGGGTSSGDGDSTDG